jgi:predicted nucleic acid-binding protein
MKRLCIYLDTSVISFLYAEDSPDFRRVTEEFFSRYAPRYELHASDVVLKEIALDPVAEHRERLYAAIAEQRVVILPASHDEEVGRLADAYVAQGVVSAGRRYDALHVAYATAFEMDVLLSWNFRHLANVRREARFAAVSQAEGYWHSPRILSPLEMADETDD